MPVFDQEIAMAIEMIKEDGQLVNWIKSGIGAPSSTTPWKTAETPPNPATHPVRIVFTDPKAGSLIELLAGTSVPTGAPYGLMAAVTGFTPEINDSVDRAGDNLVVKKIDIVAPNGEIILYKISFA